LKNCPTPNDVRNALETLPKDLDETYDRILQQIPEGHVDYAKAALMWLCFSERPLQLEELAEAVILKPCQPLDENNRLHDPRQILSICGSLILYDEKAPTFDDDDDERTVALSHYSVKEYLVSERFQQKTELSTYANAIQNSQKIIAECCLTNVLFFRTCIKRAGVPDCLGNYKLEIEPGYAFLEYCAQFGFRHLDNVKTPEHQSGILDAHFCPPFGTEFFRPFELVANLGTWTGPLYFAAQNDFCVLAKHLLQHGVDVNQVYEVPFKSGGFETAVQIASAEASEAMVQLLLDKGADVNAKPGLRGRGTALAAAADRGHEAIVRMLLEKGADVNIVGGEFGTALGAAAYIGHEAIVRLLLEKGADVKIVGGEYGCALGAAAASLQCMRHYRENPVEVIALLLGAGGELEAVPVQYREFVQEAAEEAGIPRQLEAQAGDG
jgi:hypothetical protein